MPSLHAPPTRSRTAAAALLAVLALAAGGCSSSSSSSAAAPSQPASSATQSAAPIATTVTLGRVAGAFHPDNRKVFRKVRGILEKRVAAAVDGWLDGAFVGVAYPRNSFDTAFATFTSGARRDAIAQKTLMTNWQYRNRIDGVTVTRRAVTLDVLAPHGRPAGVTARVDLRFRTTGHVRKLVEVKGRLFLTPDQHRRWRIFGYDVTKDSK